MQNMLRFVFAVLVLLTLATTVPTRAQTDQICFRNVPGVGSCIGGRFYEYWKQNGGLAIFGYPLTDEFEQQTQSGTFTVQYFERQRFELHPAIARPYDVLLGHLGNEILLRQGRDWHNDPVPSANPDGSCQSYEVTQQIVCNDFVRYWLAHGLNLDFNSALTYANSLALFGLPLTEAKDETNADGFHVRTQWFERARMELYPNNPTPYIVLLGRLGADALDGVQNTVAGIRVDHDPIRQILHIESQRYGSMTTVTYNTVTSILCANGTQAPAGVLDHPSISVSAQGSYNRDGMLVAQTIMTPAC